jgi:hypothetical protein
VAIEMLEDRVHKAAGVASASGGGADG